MDDDHGHDLSILDDLLASEAAGLTAWEMDFIESLDKKRVRPFSEKQRDILIRIYRERMN